MDKKRLLIVSSSFDETITQWILSSKNRKSSKICASPIDVLTLEELLSVYDIQDELTQKEAVIRWVKDGDLKYTNKTHDLLNRIIYIEDRLFQSYEKEDQEYAKREFEAYLGFALNSFTKVQDIGISGVCEKVYSLPSQWMRVQKELNLIIPHYYWGFKERNPLVDVKEYQSRLIYSHIYNFLNWSNTNEISDELTQFCFIKPYGEPIVLFSLGEKYLLSTAVNLSKSQQRHIKKIWLKIKKLFNYFIFELVLFVQKEIIIFGCINIDLIRASKNPYFSHFMDSYFLKEYYKCLHLSPSYQRNIDQR